MTVETKPDINVIVLSQDCLGRVGETISPEECEAIAAVFLRAAAAIRKGEHGTVAAYDVGEEILAEVGIDQGDGFPFDDVKGLPMIQEYKL